MSTRILPVIGSKGTYELLPPFDTQILAEELYTCKAIRNISEYVSYNQDAKKLVYDYYGLTQEDYENDIEEDMEIVSLQNNKGVWLYVPARYIVKYPEVDGVPYHQVSVVCKLPAIEVSKNLDYLKTDLTNLIKDTLGLEPSINIVEVSRIIAVTKQISDNLKIERAALSRGKVTDRSRYAELLQQQQVLMNQIKLLEDYIKRINGVFRLDGPKRVVKGSVVPYKIIGFNEHLEYEVSVNVGSVEVNNRFIEFTAPDEVTEAIITVNDVDFVISVLEELPNLLTPVIHIINDGAHIGPDVGFITDDFQALFIDDDHITSDWEIATDADFTNIVSSIYNSSVYKTHYITTNLAHNTTYYVRVKFYGGEVNSSDWGVLMFTTRDVYIDTPSITQPLHNSNNLGPNVTFVSDEFSVMYGSDVHRGSIWQVATDNNFTDIVASTTETGVNLTSFTANNLLADTTYYVRVKYIGYTKGESHWSSIVTINTLVTYIVTPTIINPVNNAIKLGPSVELVSSEFKTLCFSDEHVSTDWQIATDVNFNTIVFEKLGETEFKTRYHVDRLDPNDTYYARVRYVSEINGISAWSPTVTFSTQHTYIHKPYILFPITNTENLGPVIDFTSSLFKADDIDVHLTSSWQVSTDENFSKIVFSVTDSVTDKTTFNVKNIDADDKYYVRVKYKGLNGYWSDWSDTIYFFTHPSYITTPIISIPKQGELGLGSNVSLVSSAFESVAYQSHGSSDWMVSTDENFSSGISATNSPFLTKFTAKNLQEGTIYYVKVRYRSKSGLVSDWSDIIQFSTVYKYIEKPSILIPDHGTRDLYDNISFKSSPFKSHAISGHKSSTWSIKKKTDLNTSEVIVNELESFEYLTQYNLMDADTNSTYLVKVKYKDSNGLSSEWSETTVIVTRPHFAASPEYDEPAMTE